MWLSVQPRSCNAYKRVSLSESGRGRRAKSARAARLRSCRRCRPTSLEPRSSEGGGGKICHLLVPPSSSGRLEVCLHVVTKSNPRLAFAGGGARVPAGNRLEGPCSIVSGEQTNLGEEPVSHLRLRLCVVLGALLALVAIRQRLGREQRRHQPGLRWRRERRRDANERLHRDPQPHRDTRRRDGLVGAVRVLHGNDLGGHRPQRDDLRRRVLPRPGSTGHGRYGGSSDTGRHRHHRDGCNGRQGRARRQQHGAFRRVPSGLRRSRRLWRCQLRGDHPDPATSNTLAALRANNGCTDTDNNSADFTIAAPSPRNSASAADTCGSDNAPSLVSSVPSNGATDVATGSSISLTFSEPVNVTDPWFTIQCVVSGSHSATVSGGPTTFTLQPMVAFAQGESCTVTLAGSAITDQDAIDPPDAVVGTPSFSFTTAAPVVAARS